MRARTSAAPGGGNHQERATNDHTAAGGGIDGDSIGLDRFSEVPTAEDRAESAAIGLLLERGYRIAVRCRVCGHWLTTRRSLSRFIGPKCAARGVVTR